MDEKRLQKTTRRQRTGECPPCLLYAPLYKKVLPHPRRAAKKRFILQKQKFSVLHDFFKVFLAILLTTGRESCKLIIA